MNQPRMFANPARGHQTRKTVFLLSPFTPENTAWRDKFDCPVPRQHSLSTSRLNLILTSEFQPFPPLSATASIYPVNRHRASLDFYRVTHAVAYRSHNSITVDFSPTYTAECHWSNISPTKSHVELLFEQPMFPTKRSPRMIWMLERFRGVQIVLCSMVITYSRVWINRVRLPILLVIS